MWTVDRSSSVPGRLVRSSAGAEMSATIGILAAISLGLENRKFNPQPSVQHAGVISSRSYVVVISARWHSMVVSDWSSDTLLMVTAGTSRNCRGPLLSPTVSESGSVGRDSTRLSWSPGKLVGVRPPGT